MNSTSRIRTGAALRLALLCVTCLVLLTARTWSVQAAKGTDKSVPNYIYVAYDDSGSMMMVDNGQTAVDRWCRAKYALEVFSAMMQTKDQMKIYPLNYYELYDDTYESTILEVSGSTSAAERIAQIENYSFGYGQHTPYERVEQAYADLLKVQDESARRWLVVLTDGDFDNTSVDDLNENFKKYAASGVSVVFLRIFESGETNKETPKDDRENGIYCYEAANSEQILGQINEISNLIFKQQEITGSAGALQKSDSKVTYTLDVPAEKIIVFAQGPGVSVGDMGGTAACSPERTSINCPQKPANEGNGGTTLKGANSKKSEDLIPLSQDDPITKELMGVIAVYSPGEDQALPKGTYEISVAGANSISVYCKPAVEPVAQVLQGSETISAGETIYEGDVTVQVNLVNSKDHSETLDPSSPFLSNVKYNIVVDGEEYDTSNVGITAKAGSTVTVSGTVTINDSEYQLEETTFSAVGKVNLGSLSVTDIGVDPADPEEVYADLKSGGTDPGVVFTVQEDGAVPAEDHLKGLKVTVAPSAGSEALEFDTEPEYLGDGKYRVAFRCTDPSALKSEEGSKQLSAVLQASMTVIDGLGAENTQTAGEQTITIDLVDGNHIGDLTAQIISVPDGAGLYEMLRDKSEDCAITVLVQENGAALSEERASAVKLTASVPEELAGKITFADPVRGEDGTWTIGMSCDDVRGLIGNSKTMDLELGVTAGLTLDEDNTAQASDSTTVTISNPTYTGALELSVGEEPDAEVLYRALAGKAAEGDPEAAIAVQVLEDGAAMTDERLSKLKVTAAAGSDTGVTFETRVDGGGQISIIPTCSDISKLTFTGNSAEIPYTIDASLDLSGDSATAQTSGTLKVRNPYYTGAMELTVDEQPDAQVLCRALSGTPAEDDPEACLYLSVTEDGEPMPQARIEELKLDISPDEPIDGLTMKGSADGDGRIKVTVSCEDITKLPFVASTAEIPYTAAATLDLGEEPASAQVQGTLKVTDEQRAGSLEITNITASADEVVYEELRNGTAALTYQVEVAEDGTPISEDRASYVTVTAAADSEQAASLIRFSAEYAGGNVWTLTPQITGDCEPLINRDSMIIQPFSVTAEMNYGENVQQSLPYASELRLSVNDPGIDANGGSIVTYDIKTIATDKTSAVGQEPVIVTFTRRGEQLTDEEWDAVVIDSVVCTNRSGEELTDTEAGNGSLRLTFKKDDDGTVKVYPYADGIESYKFKTKKQYYRVNFHYEGEEATEAEEAAEGDTITPKPTGSFRVKGLSLWWRLWQFFLKNWWWIIPLAVVLAILSRYIPRDCKFIPLPPFIGRMYGFNMKDRISAEHKKKEYVREEAYELYPRPRICWDTVLKFWKEIEWKVRGLEGVSLSLRIDRNAQVKLTESSYRYLAGMLTSAGNKPAVYSSGDGKPIKDKEEAYSRYLHHVDIDVYEEGIPSERVYEKIAIHIGRSNAKKRKKERNKKRRDNRSREKKNRKKK